MNCFQKAVLLDPKRVAARCGDQTISYQQLDALSSGLAGELLHADQRPGDLIGICMRPSLQLIVAIIGVLKAKMAYVPLDPSYPAKRLEFIARDVRTQVIIQSGGDSLPTALHERVANLRILSDGCTFKFEYREASSKKTASALPQIGLAYIIYTSGTTGTPKGVCTTIANLEHYLAGIAKRLAITCDDTALAATSISFDPHTTELLLPLALGGRVVIAQHGRSSPEELSILLDSFDVTYAQGTPSFWKMMLDHGWRPRSRVRILSGGEAMTPSLREQLVAGTDAELWNLYGPTETTVYCSAARIQRKEEITLGEPLDGTSFRVVNSDGELASAGEEGELWIGGAGIMAGYFGQPELTNKAMARISHANGETELYYRSGDWVRVGVGGRISFRNRIDKQVKIRGHRVELDEVANVLRTFECVRDAEVLEVDSDRLVAFVIANEAHELSESRLNLIRTELATLLPEFMIPYKFVALAAFPLTANDKIDRSELLRIFKRRDAKLATLSTEDLLERDMKLLWETVLGCGSILPESTFDQVGGHSLNAVTLKLAITGQFGIDVPLSIVTANPTLRQICDFVRSSKQSSQPVIRRTKQASGTAPMNSSQLLLYEELPPDKIENYLLEFLLSSDAPAELLKAAADQVFIENDIFRICNSDPMKMILEFASAPTVMTENVSSSFSNEADFLEAIPKHRARVSPRSGLFYYACVYSSGERSLLFVALNHMIADAQTISILKMKISLAARDISASAPAGQDYFEWLCQSHKKTKCISPSEDEFWSTMLPRAVPQIKVSGNGISHEIRSTSTTLAFQPGTRGAILHNMLLSSIVHCIARSQDWEVVPCRLVGNGRDYENSDTLGWCSHHYPALCTVGDSVADTYSRIATLLSDLRPRSADFGWRRYVHRATGLAHLPSLSMFPIYFNYVPEKRSTQLELFESSHELPPLFEARNTVRGMSFVAIDQGGKLVLTLYYDRAIVSDEIAEEMLSMTRSTAISLQSGKLS
ncbi:hypothetical protein ATY76_22420 [Rhizobium sp. R339]|nr:hypothetical protein ATY76_22420 [Rhizobium sp. R339]